MSDNGQQTQRPELEHIARALATLINEALRDTAPNLGFMLFILEHDGDDLGYTSSFPADEAEAVIRQWLAAREGLLSPPAAGEQ